MILQCHVIVYPREEPARHRTQAGNFPAPLFERKDCMTRQKGIFKKSFYSLGINYLCSLKHRGDANFSLLCFVLVGVTSSKSNMHSDIADARYVRLRHATHQVNLSCNIQCSGKALGKVLDGKAPPELHHPVFFFSKQFPPSLLKTGVVLKS